MIGIFTKPHHVEKIANFMNIELPEVRFIISSDKHETKLPAFDFDIGISYCCPFIVDVTGKRWYNYHPAPLPEYKGSFVYAEGIKRGVQNWAVTLHRMTNKVDEGEILVKMKFDIDKPYSTSELGTAAHFYLFQLFRNTIKLIIDGTY